MIITFLYNTNNNNHRDFCLREYIFQIFNLSINVAQNCCRFCSKIDDYLAKKKINYVFAKKNRLRFCKKIDYDLQKNGLQLCNKIDCVFFTKLNRSLHNFLSQASHRPKTCN